MFDFIKRFRQDADARKMILDLYSGGEAALKCRILRECGDRPLAAAVVSGVLLSQGLHELEALPDNYFKEASDFAVHLVKSDSMFRELLVQTLHIKYMVHSHDGDQSATQEVLDNPFFKRFAAECTLKSLEDYKALAIAAGEQWGLGRRT